MRKTGPLGDLEDNTFTLNPKPLNPEALNPEALNEPLGQATPSRKSFKLEGLRSSILKPYLEAHCK